MKFSVMPRYQMRKAVLKELLRQAAVCPGNSIFEMGYGAGEIFNLYKEMGLRIYGYDFSEIAYEYAQKNYADENVTLYKEKPEPKKQFDCVVACEVLEHIENDVEALKEWRMYLKDNGKIIISVPAHKKRWGASDVYVGHYRRYEREELKSKLAEAGMRIEKMYTYDFPVCFLLDMMRNHNMGKKIKRERDEKNHEEHSKTSGVEREFSPLVFALSNPVLWNVITKFAKLFYGTDWGSGYIVLASAG